MTKNKIAILLSASILICFIIYKNNKIFNNTQSKQQTSDSQLLNNQFSSSLTEQFDPNTKSNRNYLSPQPNKNNDKTLNLKTIRQALALSEKALRTSSENQAYFDSLQDKEKINSAYRIITKVQEPETEKAFVEEQKERMDAVLFLTRALEWKENSEREYIKNLVKEVVLDDAINKAQSLNLKKSLAADRIELFANLKTIDPQAGAEIQKKATSPMSKKIIQFASNFYNLNKNTKGDL